MVSASTRSTMVSLGHAWFMPWHGNTYIFTFTHPNQKPSSPLISWKANGFMLLIGISVWQWKWLLDWAIWLGVSQSISLTHTPTGQAEPMLFPLLVTSTGKYKKRSDGRAPHSRNTSRRNSTSFWKACLWTWKIIFILWIYLVACSIMSPLLSWRWNMIYMQWQLKLCLRVWSKWCLKS